ncbi:MAG: UDP-N-acetylmuramoyl-L-alanyl-D-glutamate--2,6-diaminopimelate ligase [Candidatus Aceula meridiana]|nr:UDP-N-acetylmuramoyl-L-alanyl-D-glutamate--2,6-diaminopimelate ligase [Candidatus Aceula meridiana]
MQLKDLIEGIYLEKVSDPFMQYAIKSIELDSRKIQNGSLFVALRGTQQDGLDYILQAIEKGAICVVHEKGRGVNSFNQNICMLGVENPHDFLAKIARRFYNDPIKEVQCIGITGTNGKTTVSYLVESIFRAAQEKCGIIGTINCHFAEQAIVLNNTTPDILEITECLAKMRDSRVTHCAMEVSSHALDQGRVSGLKFKVAVFTNLTQDHLDYHHTIEEYFLAKAKLFEMLDETATAIINGDDAHGKKIAEHTSAKVVSYGFESQNNVTAKNSHLSLSGAHFVLSMEEEECEIETSLIGSHNIYNILAAAAVAHAFGIDIEQIKQGVENLVCVPGRLERVESIKDFKIFVDYAHTDDALKNVLSSLRQVHLGRILLVFGCGGDRDKTKRVKMGKVASDLADFTILTNDNPRGEDPDEIVYKIASGFEKKNYLIVLERRQAIERVLGLAKKGDLVLVAGKGHENYQILRGKIVPFDDKQIIREIISC